jgi:hypothetical protein
MKNKHTGAAWKTKETKRSQDTAFKLSCPCALTEHHAMKTYWRSGGIIPRILDLGTR